MEPSKRRTDQGLKITGCVRTGVNFYAFLPLWQKLLPLIPAFLFLYLFSSCAPGSCFEETIAYVKVSFYSNASGKQVAPDSLTLFGINMDTNKIYDKALKVQPAFVPLNSSAVNCTYVIKINGITDTLTFAYTSYPHLISKECGYSFYHTIDIPVTVTSHTIDTIRITNRNITTINEENIRIYF